VQTTHNLVFFVYGKLFGGNQLIQNTAGNGANFCNSAAIGVIQPDIVTITGEVGGNTDPH
jgi:hypothetical protein